jgi:hypothetical protein
MQNTPHSLSFKFKCDKAKTDLLDWHRPGMPVYNSTFRIEQPLPKHYDLIACTQCVCGQLQSDTAATGVVNRIFHRYVLVIDTHPVMPYRCGTGRIQRATKG